MYFSIQAAFEKPQSSRLRVALLGCGPALADAKRCLECDEVSSGSGVYVLSGYLPLWVSAVISAW